jgi:hypothetical protein
MIIIHATQKLLNTSRLKTSLYISQPSEGQMLHSWYSRLLSTGFAGKLLVMYVHEPSLLTIVCRGKTIKGIWDEFKNRLPALLKKSNFLPSSIITETAHINNYMVAKTNSKSILAHMNQMVVQLEFDCSRFNSYDNISQDLLEGKMMGYLYQTGDRNKPYITAIDYWKHQGVIEGKKPLSS